MKKNIKILKDLQNKWEFGPFCDMVNVLDLNEIRAIEETLSYIEQLEKENQSLRQTISWEEELKLITREAVMETTIPKARVKRELEKVEKEEEEIYKPGNVISNNEIYRLSVIQQVKEILSRIMEE